MVLRTREVLHGRSERFGRHDAQVDLQTLGQPNRHLRGPAQEHLADALVSPEAIHRLLRILGDHQQVEIADRVLPPAVTAGKFHLSDRGTRVQMGPQRLGDLVGLGPKQAFARFHGDVEVAKNALFGLCAEAFERSDSLLPAGLGKFFQGRHAQLAMDGRARRPSPGTRRIPKTLSGTSASSSSSIGSEPVWTSVVIFSARSLFADTRDVGQLAIRGRRNRRQRLRVVANRAGGIAVGADPKGIGVLKLQKIGNLVENSGNFGVRHGYRCNSTTSLSLRT